MTTSDEGDEGLLKAQRHTKIVEMLRSAGRLHAGPLADTFGVSGYTIRRDLDELAAEGLLERVHGGAVPTSTVGRTYAERRNQGTAEKAQSARAALSRLEPGQLVIVDGGSTAALLAEQVPERFPATFITHSPVIADLLAERDPEEVVLLGGRIDGASRVAVGAATVSAYNALTADVCFLGLWGVNVSDGVSSPYYEESLVRAAMIEAANQVVGLAVADKLGTGGAYRIAPVTALTHISVEDDAPALLTKPFEDVGVQVLRALQGHLSVEPGEQPSRPRRAGTS